MRPRPSDAPPPTIDSCDGFRADDYRDAPARFEAIGARAAIMSGFINGRTPARLRSLLEERPALELIVMPFVPGSANDEANLEAARIVRRAGLATCVPSEGMVASGGVDFFLAGVTRTGGAEARFGVHSWGDGRALDGSTLPREDPEHRKYLDYYAELGITAEFYWFTLSAAPPDDIHWMTREELDTYGVLTSASPAGESSSADEPSSGAGSEK